MYHIKRCVFCKSKKCIIAKKLFEIKIPKLYTFLYYVHCPVCGATGPVKLELTTAINSWNRRSSDSDGTMD